MLLGLFPLVLLAAPAASAWQGAPEELAPGGALLQLGTLELGGFAQLQYEHHADPSGEGTLQGADLTRHDFLIPRARLALRWAPIPELRFQAEGEAHADGGGARDVTVSFIEPWTSTGQALTAGQLRVPFGSEGALVPEQDLELATLSRATTRLFPGRRDVGVMLSGHEGLFDHALAVMSGDPDSPDAAPRRIGPDVVGRFGLRGRLGAIGVSGLVGRAFGASPSGVVSTDKWRAGGDAELSLRVPLVGVLTLRGEWIEARGFTRSRGFYAMAVQRIWRRVGLVARVDRFDPDTATANDAVLTYGFGLLVEPWTRLRALVQYDHVADHAGPVTPTGAVTDLPNDMLLVRLQAAF